MKALILGAALLAFLSTSAWASNNNSCQFASCNDNSTTTINNVTNVDETHNSFEVTEESDKDIAAGLKFDAPNLVEVSDSFHVGMEAGKDFIRTNSQEGYFAYLKGTYTGSLFSFNK